MVLDGDKGGERCAGFAACDSSVVLATTEGGERCTGLEALDACMALAGGARGERCASAGQSSADFGTGASGVGHVRTTVSLDPDVVEAVDALRSERRLGLSAALNELARAGAVSRSAREPYRHRSRRLGIRVDVSDVQATLDLFDERDR